MKLLLIGSLAVLLVWSSSAFPRAINQAVWLEDITQNAKTRNLDLGLPESLQFKLKRRGHQDLTLTLVENKRLNQNAQVYEVQTKNHQNKLVKKETSPIFDVKFYHDKKNGGSFMVECSKRLKGACRRTLTGSLEIHNEAFEIKPTAETFVSRSLAVNKRNPHMLTRVVDRTGKGNYSLIARRGHITEEQDALVAQSDKADTLNLPRANRGKNNDDEIRIFSNDIYLNPPKPEPGLVDSADVSDHSEKGLENKLAKEIRRLLTKSERNAFTEKLHRHRQKRQSTKTYAVEVLVIVDEAVWKKYYPHAVATATMTKDEATELFIRKRFSHIINGVSLRFESIDDPELNIYVTMTGIVIFKTIAANILLPNATTETCNGKEAAVNCRSYTYQLVGWLDGVSGLPRNDHVMLFTGYAIYLGEENNKRCSISGYAFMNGVCTHWRASLQVDADYTWIMHVAAHELGHNLGSEHDGGNNDAIASACSVDGFIMGGADFNFNRDRVYKVNPWRFSKCSVKQFKNYIQSLGENNCLLDAGDCIDEYKIHSSKQPGELYSPAEQCQFQFGQESELGCGQSATDPRMCLHMLCKQRNGYCINIVAADGTPCDNPSLNKWCKEGLCVAKGASGKQKNTANNTALTPEECAECTDCCWYDTPCEEVSTDFEDIYDYGPNFLCDDPSGQDRCYATCIDSYEDSVEEEENSPDQDNTSNYEEGQWVSGVLNFSSQFNTGSWSAQQILGVPNVYPSYGDLVQTWAPRDIDANQFLEFQFATPVYVTKVDVYETYNAGGVKAIKCLNVSGTWITLWSTPQVSRIQSARIFSPSFTSTIPCFSNRIRLDIDCTLANTWVEIDAVRLHGSQANNTALTPEECADCTDCCWYDKPCEEVSTDFEDIYDYGPDFLCDDPSGQDRCYATCIDSYEDSVEEEENSPDQDNTYNYDSYEDSVEEEENSPDQDNTYNYDSYEDSVEEDETSPDQDNTYNYDSYEDSVEEDETSPDQDNTYNYDSYEDSVEEEENSPDQDLDSNVEDTNAGSHSTKVSCADKYAKITTGHTGCLPMNKSGLEPGEKKLILAAHNTARRDVTPTASNMQLMSWDESIASLAQRWAENCVFEHEKHNKRTDFGRFSVGQNIAQNSGELDWSQAISGWENEKNVYMYDGDNSGNVVGHYTQMVWAESSKIGCGYADCNGLNYYVCNYGPAGNVHGQLPYEKGKSCAECQNSCNNGMCDCGGLVCLNGGTLDLKECKCTCKQPFHMQPDCALNCEGAVDPSYCESHYSGKCEEYANVPDECPNMCKWCPYADANYNK